jgi:protein associated with RNAse G/E
MQDYVDVATPAAWSDGEVSAVDLDLDVVLPHGGPPYVDDEDEFADHQVRYGYPPDLVTAARAACTAVLAAVTAARAPFDAATAQRWLERADPSWSPVVSRTPPEDQPR